MPSTTTTTTTLLLFLLLSCTPLPLSSTAHNRRILHQPLFPVDSSPPTPPPTQSPPSPTTPKYPFSSPTPPDAPFFPTYPSPPSPPSPSSIATPVNVSSLDLPKSSKSNSASSKLIIVAVAAVVAAIIVVCIAVFLHIKKRRNTAFSDTKTSRSDTSTRYNLSNNPSTSNTALNNNGINGAIPKLSRPSQTSAEFLYLGTLVSSHAGLDTHPSQHIARSVSNNASLNTPKLDSPELRPLPPLNGRRNNPNVEVGPGRDEESEEFYSPRGSIGGRESSIGGGSASRRAFAAVEVANFNGSTSSSSLYSSSSSGSGSPARSVSLSISPRFSVSPKNSRPKSPELDVIQLQVVPPVAPAPPPPPPPHARSAFTSPHKDSLSPSPTSSRYSRSVDSSPRISNGSNRNLESPVSISSPVPQSMLIFNPYYLSASAENMESSDIIRSPEKIASPEKQNTPILLSNLPISNVTDQNMEYPERISSPVKQNMHVLDPDPETQISNDENTPKISSPERLHLVPPPIFIPPPPPPPPPPSKYWESPRTPTPPPRVLVSKPPILVAPLRPMIIESPTLISPMQLPSHNETSDKNESNEKNEETPKPKLKPLHWDKVRASSDREMVWDQLRSSSFRLNEEMIESLFIFNTPNPTPKETTRRQILPSPTGENRVLDPKKSQNIAILLKALHVTVDEVCEALSEGNTDTLGTDLLENLLKMAPTKEEERKLKAHKDDSPIKLGHAERFLKAVLDIPFAFKRVDALLYIANFDSEVEYLKKSFETLESACEELRNGRMFLKLLEAVLKTGNRMNVGTNRGDAHAFKLDTLLKLVDVKGADGKTTLLHFVVQEITRSEGARLSDISDDIKCRKLGLQVVSGLSSELTNVKKAATMDSDVLNSDALKLTKGLEKISEIVKLNEESSGSDKFSESMNLFLKIAEEEMIRIQAQESVALTLVKEITEYFHGNSAREEAHPFRIFMVVRDFLTVLDRVCKEVGMINERTIVSSAHKFPVPVNPMLQSGVSSGFPGNEENNSSP